LEQTFPDRSQQAFARHQSVPIWGVFDASGLVGELWQIVIERGNQSGALLSGQVKRHGSSSIADVCND
jgi:hypothetical protein